MSTLLGTVFVASLLGSLHCAGMCGPCVAFYAGSDASPGAGRLASHAAYNGGRLLTYLVLGGVFGATGAVVDLAGSAAGLRRTAAVAAGALMIAWGVYALLQALDVRMPRMPLPRFVARLTVGAYDRLRGRPPIVRALLLGLIATFLPCGWLYAYAILAGGTGSVWSGMAVMAAFWAGTVPMMLGLGVSVQAVSAPVRRRLPVVTALILVVLGVVWVAWRAVPGSAPSGPSPSHRLVTVDEAGEGDHDHVDP